MNRAAWSVASGHLLVLVACVRTGPGAPPSPSLELHAVDERRAQIQPPLLPFVVHDWAGADVLVTPDAPHVYGPCHLEFRSESTPFRRIDLPFSLQRACAASDETLVGLAAERTNTFGRWMLVEIDHAGRSALAPLHDGYWEPFCFTLPGPTALASCGLPSVKRAWFLFLDPQCDRELPFELVCASTKDGLSYRRVRFGHPTGRGGEWRGTPRVIHALLHDGVVFLVVGWIHTLPLELAKLAADDLEPLWITHLSVHAENGSILAFEPIPLPDLGTEAGERAVLLDPRKRDERALTLIAADAATRATAAGTALLRHGAAHEVGLDIRWR